jgi:hypothetical protein
LREFEDENGKLKKLLAEQMLANALEAFGNAFNMLKGRG